MEVRVQNNAQNHFMDISGNEADTKKKKLYAPTQRETFNFSLSGANGFSTIFLINLILQSIKKVVNVRSSRHIDTR